MPVYRKGRSFKVIHNITYSFETDPKRRFKPNSNVLRLGTEMSHDKGHRVLKRRMDWIVTQTRLQLINDLYGFPPKWKLEKVVEKIAKKHTADNPTIVLDWGCGDGAAIAALGEKYKDNPRVKFVGYSKSTHKGWEANREFAKFILANKTDLPRYFKNGQIGMVFANISLPYLSVEALWNHLQHLRPKLEKGAYFFTSLADIDELKTALMIMTFRESGFKVVQIGTNAAVFQLVE